MCKLLAETKSWISPLEDYKLFFDIVKVSLGENGESIYVGNVR